MKAPSHRRIDVTIEMTKSSQNLLYLMARNDFRTAGQEIEWLLEMERRRRMKSGWAATDVSEPINEEEPLDK